MKKVLVSRRRFLDAVAGSVAIATIAHASKAPSQIIEAHRKGREHLEAVFGT